MAVNKVNNFSPDAPIDCDDVFIVVPDFGCEEPNDEPITELFWSKKPLVSGLLSEWNARLSNSATDTDGIIRSLNGIEGDLKRVEKQFKTSQRGSSRIQDVDRVIPFSIEDDKDPTFAFLKKFEKGITGFFWFRSGGHIYGGLSGIFGTLFSDYEINKDSELMAHNWDMQFRFKSKVFPDRVTAVI